MEGGGAGRGWYEMRPRGELLRYALSALVVSAIAATGAEVLTHLPTGFVATETPDVVMVDLRPALASSSPKSDAPDGPEQAASAPTPPEPPAPPPKPVVDPPREPPPPEAPRPAVVIDKKEETPPPPPPPVAPAPAAAEQAPSGADVPKAVVEQAEPLASTPDARALAAWQRAMVERLEVAKHRSARHSHLAGTVIVAFRIDRRGRLVEKNVDETSGSAVLDDAALTLLADASPFPAPPAGVGEVGLTFTVPVRFNPRR